MQTSTFLKSVLFCFVLVINTAQLFAQPATSDKNIHRDPMVMKPGYVAPDPDATSASVITIGNYDNFKLGTDFAECSITVNPLNPLQMYAVWNTTGTAGGKGYRTVNGFDWTSANPSWTGMSGDVVVTSDSAGRLIYENMYGANIQGSKVVTSADFGQTWDPVVIAVSGVDKNWIAADQTGGAYSNYIYTTMTSSGGGNHARSINNGGMFTNTNNFSTQSLPGMMIAVGPKIGAAGNSVYVVTNSGSSFAATYTFYESLDGGLSFAYKSTQNFANYVGSNVGGRNSVQNMRTRPYPYLAADNSNGPHRGRLYLVYASNFPSGNGNKPDIFCRYSDNGGSTWSTAVTVNDDLNTANNHNWFPAIWNDTKTGRLYVSWMDTRDCPTSDSALIYASYSDDGITFAPNQPLSTKKMKINCTSCGGGGSPAYLGDYNGVASNGNVSIMAWTDFRDNSFGSYVAYFPDYALKIEPAIDTLSPTATLMVKVPSVKLYTDTVNVSAIVTGGGAGAFTVSYPQGNQIYAYPGEIPIEISSNGSVPLGEYSVEITTTGSNGTPIHKRLAAVRVISVTAPTAAFTANTTILCQNQSVQFTDHSSGPPSSWDWSFPGGTPSSSTLQNPVVFYSEPGVYSVSLTVSNQAGTNSISNPSYITVNLAPAAPVANNQSICFGQPVPNLTATGTGLQWYSAGSLVGTGNSYETGQSAVGTYNYTVTSSENGCESLPTSVSLTINPLPNVSMSSFPPVCLSAAAFDLTAGFPIGGVYSGNGVSGGQVFNPSIAGVGVSTITYVYTNMNGCIDSTSQTITVNPLPEISMNAITPACINALPIVLTANPVGGVFSGLGVSADTLYPSVSGAGSHAISYTFNDPITGCSNTVTQNAIVFALPVVIVNDASTCGNRSILFDATVNNAASYLWTPGGATTATLSIDTTGKGLGAYKYIVQVTDINNCISSDSAMATFFDCTGIDENESGNWIEITPNPNKGEFVIKSSSIPSGNYYLIIYNSNGQIVMSDNQVTINAIMEQPVSMPNMANGTYFIRLSNNVKSYTSKFVISK